MDASIGLNLATVLMSVLALLVSALLAYRQIGLTVGANHLPVILDAFREIRSVEFQDSQKYIFERLTSEHGSARGYRDIDEPARSHLQAVGSFYDDLGKLVAHKIIDEGVIIGAYGDTIMALWKVIRPYVCRERELRGTRGYVYFEDLACRALSRSSVKVHQELGLRKWPYFSNNGSAALPESVVESQTYREDTQ